MIRNTAASPPLNVSKKEKQKTKNKSKMKVDKWPCQNPNSSQIQMLMDDLKHAVKKVSSVAEPKNSGSKFFHSDVEDSLPVITNS